MSNLTRTLLTLVGAAQPLIAATLITNPSFESNYNPTFPGYGPIDGWSGGSGVNEGTGPFHNGGTPIPDRSRVAFLQGSSTLKQTISGLTPGEVYWIQFDYDARGCCGGTIDVITRFGSADLDRIVNIKPASGGKTYLSRSVSFIPDADTGDLIFATAASGDATALIDGVTIVQRSDKDIVVFNPSFEASGAAPEGESGVIAPAGISGWVGEGTYGADVSGVGSFADNGTNPDQDSVGFIQGVGALSQVINNLSAGTKYDLSFSVNARSGNTPHLKVSVDGTAALEADIAAVGAADYARKTVSFTPAGTSAEIRFEQTVDGDQTLLLDDVRIIGTVIKPLDPSRFDPTGVELSPGLSATFTLTVDPRLIESAPASFIIRVADKGVAQLVGAADDGSLTIHFDQKGSPVKSFTAQANGRGVVRVEVVDDAHQSFANDVTINVVTSFVRNPSFEASSVGAAPGYSEIASWTGDATTGLNKADGPFHDNGSIPDRLQVAFLQGTTKLRQDVHGLEAGKNYWLQFAYNARDCCAGGSIDLAVNWDGVEITKITGVTASGAGANYPIHQVAFIPIHSGGVLEFASKAVGDATVLIDAVSIVQRNVDEIVILNPSFEAEGSPVGVGYLQPSKIAGWNATGGYGVNITGVGPFSDNGTAPDQDRVFLLQGNGSSISQTIGGLSLGQPYTLLVALNARNCCGNEATGYRITLGADVVAEADDFRPVGGKKPYRIVRAVFSAADESLDLKITHTSAAGDHTLLVDSVRILPGDVPPPVTFGFTNPGDGTIRITWTTFDTDGLVLQSAPTLSGPWADVATAPVVDGDDNAVIESASDAARYYRLIK